MKLSLTPVAYMLAFVCGCGGITSPSPNDNVVAVAIDASTCAVNTCDGGSNVWRHDCNQSLITNPKINLIFWGKWWPNQGSSMQTSLSVTWDIVANDPQFYYPLAEYGIGRGYLAGMYNTNFDLADGNISELNIQDQLNSELGFSLPTNDSDSIFVIELPPTTKSQYDIDSHFNGHHFYINNSAVYSVVEYNDNVNNINITTSHEIYESATNPFASGGWFGPGGETEIGDLCHTTYSLNHFEIQKVWSQEQCQCVP